MIQFLDIKQINALHQTCIDDAIHRVINSGWFIKGKELECFQRKYADFIGTKFAVGVGNGFDALTIMFISLIEMGKLNVGDHVMVPANTFIASVSAIVRAGLQPVFIDAHPDTLLLDENLLHDNLTKKTKAILIVHLYGKCACSDNILKFCQDSNLLLLEDNAQAHGCVFKQNRTGSLGFAAAHSFYPGKNLGALGDAGAITTDSFELANIASAIANYGFTEKYYAEFMGFNSRLDEIQAAVLTEKLKFLDHDNDLRKNVAEKYYKNINNDFIKLPCKNIKRDNVYHLFPILTKYRNELQVFLMNKGIQTLIHYPVPPHKQKGLKKFNALNLPVAENIAKQELSIPISPVLTDDQVNSIINAINEFIPSVT